MDGCSLLVSHWQVDPLLHPLLVSKWNHFWHHPALCCLDALNHKVCSLVVECLNSDPASKAVFCPFLFWMEQKSFLYVTSCFKEGHFWQTCRKCSKSVKFCFPYTLKNGWRFYFDHLIFHLCGLFPKCKWTLLIVDTVLTTDYNFYRARIAQTRVGFHTFPLSSAL